MIDKLPKQPVPATSSVSNSAVSCSTPRKDSIVVTDGKSPESLSESPVFEIHSEHSQPFDLHTWSKEQIAKIKELRNTESFQIP